MLLLRSIITDNINHCAPVTNVTLRRPSAPWINNEVKEAILERNKGQKLLKENRHYILLQQKFKEIKKRVKGLINSTKKKYYHQQLNNCKHNTSATWRTLRTTIPYNKQSTTIMPDGNMKNKVEDFSKFFENVGQHTLKQLQRH